jgi:hypothetical protein
MKYRGFKVNYPYEDLDKYAEDNQIRLYTKNYCPTDDDIKINQQRLIEKYNLKPNFYRWTKREIPDFLK